MSDLTRRDLLDNVATITAATLALPAEQASALEVSSLRRNEELRLMPTAAHQSEDGRQWVVPLHAWVYVPQNSRARRGAIARSFKRFFDLELTPENTGIFDTRVNLLLADNKGGRSVVVDVAGHRVTLPPTAPNGHSQAIARIPVSASTPEGSRLTIRAVLPALPPRAVETSVHLIGPAGLSIISDIDDTVKITHVLDRRSLLESTFYKPFEAADGMPAAYQRIASAGTAFHYVSSSPWHLSGPLLEFLAASGLPLSSIALKQIRLKDADILNIFKPARETKPPEIEAILTKYPRRRFILIGDSGEDDPEVYAEALLRHPTQIARIYIRNVTSARRDDPRFATTFGRVDPTQWSLFEDAAEIRA